MWNYALVILIGTSQFLEDVRQRFEYDALPPVLFYKIMKWIAALTVVRTYLQKKYLLLPLGQRKQEIAVSSRPKAQKTIAASQPTKQLRIEGKRRA